MSTDRLSGLTIVVTGSSSGTGRQIALSFADAGAKLVVCADIHQGPSQAKLWSLPDGEPSGGRDMAVKAVQVHKGDAADQDVPTHDLITQKHGPGRAKFIRCDVRVEDAAADGDMGCLKEAIGAAVKASGRLDV